MQGSYIRTGSGSDRVVAIENFDWGKRVLIRTSTRSLPLPVLIRRVARRFCARPSKLMSFQRQIFLSLIVVALSGVCFAQPAEMIRPGHADRTNLDDLRAQGYEALYS